MRHLQLLKVERGLQNKTPSLKKYQKGIVYNLLPSAITNQRRSPFLPKQQVDYQQDKYLHRNTRITRRSQLSLSRSSKPRWNTLKPALREHR